MTKFHSILILAIISIFSIGCDNTNLNNSDFIGEYEMTTEIITVYDDAEFDGNPIVKSNVSIYRKNGLLFIQTNYYGMPFVGGDNPIPIEDENNRLENDNPNSNLVDVIVKYSDVIISNGFVQSILNSIIVKSHPISIRKIGNSQLVMANRSRSFKVMVYDIAGERDEETFHFEYEPIIKQNDILTWELSLIPHHPIMSGREEIAAIKYKNILRKVN
jgi:hypothetical protein